MIDAPELVRRFSATMRSSELYAPTHPIVQRAAASLGEACDQLLRDNATVIVGFLDSDVVVNDYRLPKATTAMATLIRDMRDRRIEKVTFARGVDATDIRALVEEFRDRDATSPLGDRLLARGVRRISVGRVAVEEESTEAGIAAARQIYGEAVNGAERIWTAARAGETPDPAAARRIIDSLSKMIHGDRTSLMALTALKRHDSYTFTHMVNVSALAMALARSLNIEGPMLREFGLAALMHDIGKVQTPQEILNKPEALTAEELEIMKRHVIDGAHILRRTPEVPALAPVVAFEHHLKMDLSGYPEGIGTRKLNLCTMVVTVVDVFDALRSNRTYRSGLATDRIKAIMQQQDGRTFNRTLLRRFVNLMGMYPVGTLVRLTSNELAVVTREQPDDPFRPQVKLIQDGDGQALEKPVLANTWERDDRGDYPRAIVEAVDHEPLGIDPLKYLDPDGSERDS